MKLIDRFSGSDGRRHLLEALRNQVIIRGDEAMAEAFAEVAELEEHSPAETLIRQGDADNHLLLILAGRVAVFVNGNPVAERGPGRHIGEMAALDPGSRRTATIVAKETTVVAKVSEKDLDLIGTSSPNVWRRMAVELSHRLDERQKFHRTPNSTPILFVGSSKESLPYAEALVGEIPGTRATVRLWTDRVFQPSHFTIEDLEGQVRVADFAVLIAGPDDQISSRGKDVAAPRDNVIFELGFFMGVLTRHRTFLLVQSDVDLKIPSDLLGLTPIRYPKSTSAVPSDMKLARDELMAAIEKMGPRRGDP